MLASPDSLTGQLDFIREHWAPYLGDDIKRILLAIDVLREEDVAIWMRFHPPGPDQFRHGPSWGSMGLRAMSTSASTNCAVAVTHTTIRPRSTSTKTSAPTKPGCPTWC